MVRIAVLAVFGLALACGRTPAFDENLSTKDERSPSDVDSGEPPPAPGAAAGEPAPPASADATPAADATPGVAIGENGVVVTPDALDENGQLEDDCLEEIHPLPASLSELAEAVHWKPTGPTAAYDQVMAAPVVGRLVKGEATPAIVTVAFKANAGCLASPYTGCGPAYTSDGGYVYAIDGATGQQRWVSSLLVVPSQSPALGDLDGSGLIRVVVIGLDGRLSALGADGQVVWTSKAAAWPLPSALVRGGPTLADVDGDGQVEVVTPTTILAAATGEVKATLEGPAPGGYPSALVAETDGRPGLEIVTSDGIFDGTGKRRCSFPETLTSIAAARLHAGDATATVLGWTGTAVAGYDGATCARLFATAANGDSLAGPINVADFDGDGVLDFGTAGTKAYAAYHADGALMWQIATKDASSSQTGSTTFDFDGNGKSEIVYNDEDYLRILDGATGRELYRAANSSGTLFEYPVIADVNGDGHADLVVGANDTFGYTNRSATGIRVFRAPQNDWVGTRPAWNQYGFNPLDVGPDGKLAGYDREALWKPWVKAEYLLGFRNNVPMRGVKEECRKP